MTQPQAQAATRTAAEVPSQSPPVDDALRLSALIEQAYGAGLSPSRWRNFVAEATAYCGSALGALLVFDRREPRRSFLVTAGLDDRFEKAFAAGWRESDDYYLQGLRQRPAGSAWHGNELIPDAALRHGPLYQELAQPWGLEHFLGGVVENDDSLGAYLSFMRGGTAATYSDADKESLSRMLLPHVRRSLHLHRDIERLSQSLNLRENPGQSDTVFILARFDLTFSEQRLAEQLLTGRTLAEAAQALGVSRNTAKTHLARIFDKTGARSQMALLRLLTSERA